MISRKSNLVLAILLLAATPLQAMDQKKKDDCQKKLGIAAVITLLVFLPLLADNMTEYGHVESRIVWLNDDNLTQTYSHPTAKLEVSGCHQENSHLSCSREDGFTCKYTLGWDNLHAEQPVVAEECKLRKGSHFRDFFTSIRKKTWGLTQAEKEAEYLAEVQEYFQEDDTDNESTEKAKQEALS